MLKKVSFTALIAALLLAGSLATAVESDLSNLAKSKSPLKVYVNGFTDESGENLVIPEDFKKALEVALTNRKSVKFEITASRDSGDVEISGIIRKFRYLERGPMKVSPSAGGMLLDAMATATHNYVEMNTRFTVTDIKTGRLLWDNTIEVYAKKKMSPDESVPVIYDKISRVFLSECFGHPGGTELTLN